MSSYSFNGNQGNKEPTIIYIIILMLLAAVLILSSGCKTTDNIKDYEVLQYNRIILIEKDTLKFSVIAYKYGDNYKVVQKLNDSIIDTKEFKSKEMFNKYIDK